MSEIEKLKNIVVLVVEDERPLAQAITTKLQEKGVDTISARTADQALDYLETVKDINAVWLDHYLLGQKSGLDIIMKLKEDNSPWKHLPVFVVSNTVTDAKVQTYMKLGADKYFVKSSTRLSEIIESVLEHCIKDNTIE